MMNETGADIPVLFIVKCLMYIYFQDLFDLSHKQTSKIDILLGEIRSSCDCECLGGGGGATLVHKRPWKGFGTSFFSKVI